MSKIAKKANGKSRIKYICVMCEKAAGTGTLECISCAQWVHYQCVPMTKEQFQEYGRVEEYFVCPNCACTTCDDGKKTFNSGWSLERYVQHSCVWYM